MNTLEWAQLILSTSGQQLGKGGSSQQSILNCMQRITFMYDAHIPNENQGESDTLVWTLATIGFPALVQSAVGNVTCTAVAVQIVRSQGPLTWWQNSGCQGLTSYMTL